MYIDNLDVGVDFADEGPWRSWYLTTEGSTLKECLDNASIAEVDQDGGDLDCYGIDDAPSEVYNVCVYLIQRKLDEEAPQEVG